MNENTEIIATADFITNRVRPVDTGYNFGKNFFIVIILIELLAVMLAAAV
jgi:hypothetical protein